MTKIGWLFLFISNHNSSIAIKFPEKIRKKKSHEYGRHFEAYLEMAWPFLK